jgi:hypothetical protein
MFGGLTTSFPSQDRGRAPQAQAELWVLGRAVRARSAQGEPRVRCGRAAGVQGGAGSHSGGNPNGQDLGDKPELTMCYICPWGAKELAAIPINLPETRYALERTPATGRSDRALSSSDLHLSPVVLRWRSGSLMPDRLSYEQAVGVLSRRIWLECKTYPKLVVAVNRCVQWPPSSTSSCPRSKFQK